MEKENGKTIVVTGATGRQGGAVARELLKAGYLVRALTRNPSSRKAKALSRLGAEVLKCDLTDTDTLKQALAGAWGVFAVFQSPEKGERGEMETGRRFTATAKNSGVKHFVYSSAAAANQKTGVPHFDSKAVIEAAVIGARFSSHVILRPAFLMENFTSPWLRADLELGRLCMALEPETKLQMIAAEDIGKFGLAAFRRPADFNGAEIDIAGDERTLPEAADILPMASGRRLQFVQADISEVRKQSPGMAAMMEWLDRAGPKIDLQAIRAKYGFKLLTLSQWAMKVRWPLHTAGSMGAFQA